MGRGEKWVFLGRGRDSLEDRGMWLIEGWMGELWEVYGLFLRGVEIDTSHHEAIGEDRLHSIIAFRCDEPCL